MKVLNGNNPVYRINLYNGRFVVVETDWSNSLYELCLAVAREQAKGKHVTSVVQLSEGRSTPRVKVMGTKAYRDAVKQVEKEKKFPLVGESFRKELEAQKSSCKKIGLSPVGISFDATEVKEDVCPFCGETESLTYPGGIEVIDKSAIYSVVCNSCGAEFQEYYRLEFDRITV
ncbi:hypothetical protein [Anaerotignum lactatifermentans]|uniref:hypothetical protein n=1 Tax=Anaerotignum lactatifermentans TaxID=160404 RepID=UPI003AB40322